MTAADSAWQWLLHVMSDLTAIDFANRDKVQTSYAFEASDIYGPPVERLDALKQLLRSRVARTTERQNAASRTEVVIRRTRTPLVQGETFPRRKQAKAILRYTMIKCAPPAADRAIANPNVIDLCVNFKPYGPAVARTLVCLHAGLAHWMGNNAFYFSTAERGGVCSRRSPLQRPDHSGGGATPGAVG